MLTKLARLARISTLLTALGAAAAGRADWDGLDELREVAEEVGLPLETPSHLDMHDLTPHDALVIVGPEHALPVGALSLFMRTGGRVALLDDYGHGEELLRAYEVTRRPAEARRARWLRDDPNLLLAFPAHRHPLDEGVPVLLANRAVELSHPDLLPLFALGERDAGLLLSGAVGAGRFIAIGDASLLIDQHMQIPSHRRFARNLLAYLHQPAGRTFLIEPDAILTGSYGGGPSGLARIEEWLKQASHPDLPDNALLVLCASALAMASVLTLGGLPRGSPYVRPDLFPDSRVHAGFAAKTAVEPAARDGYLWQALDYRAELYAALGAAGDDGAARAALFATLQSRGLDAPSCAKLRTLLERLDTLATAAGRAGAAPRVGETELENMVRTGQELLSRIGDHRA